MTKRSYTKNRKPDPRKGIPTGEQSPRRAVARELKAGGMTYAQIGERMGITRQRAQQLVAPTPLMQKKLVARANGKCERCGKGGKLHGHHNNYDGNPGEFLCASCHQLEHLKNMENPEKVSVKKNVSLRQESIEIVRAHGKRIGVKPLSTALNSLIIQFDRMQQPAAPAVAQPAEAPVPAPEPATTAA